MRMCMPHGVDPLLILAFVFLAIVVVVINDVQRPQRYQRWLAKKGVHLSISASVRASIWLGTYFVLTFLLWVCIQPQVRSQRAAMQISGVAALVIMVVARLGWRSIRAIIARRA
jgi:hypothetical protein